MLNVAGSGSALSGGAAGKSSGLFHVRFEGCWEAVCLLAGFDSANMCKLAVVGFAQSVLKSAADLFALVRCCPIVTVFSLSLSFPLFSGRLGFARLRGSSFGRSRWVMRSLGELRSRRLSAGLGAEHEQRVYFHAAMRELMERIVHGPLALQ